MRFEEGGVSVQSTEFQRGVIRPFECFSEGWQLVKPEYWLMVGVCFVGILIGSVAPFGLLLGPMMCGIHMCIFTLARGEKPTFNLLFKGFDLFLPSFIATLVQVVPMMIVIVPVYIAFIIIGMSAGALAGSQGGEPPPEFFAIVFGGIALVVLIVVVASLVIGMLFLFTFQLIVDRGLSGWQASVTSAKAVFGNIGGALGLLIIAAVAGFAGALVCYVPVFFVLPITFAAFDVAYRRVFPAIAAPPPSSAPPPPQYPNYGDRYAPGT